MLEYRRRDDDHEFDAERAFCEAMGSFVSPMKADVCNDRHGLHHAEHCDVFREDVRE